MRVRQGILDEPYVGTVSLKLPQSDNIVSERRENEFILFHDRANVRCINDTK